MREEASERAVAGRRYGVAGAGRTLAVAGAFALVLFVLTSGAAAAAGAGFGHSQSAKGGSSGDSILATVPGIHSIAVSPTQLFATTTVNCTQVLEVNPAGHVKVIGVLPIPVSQCGEGSVALAPNHWAKAPGQGGPIFSMDTLIAGHSDQNSWGNSAGYSSGHDCKCTSRHGSLFDIQEGQLFLIGAHGHKISLFATIATNPDPAVDFGLTWDSVGSFGHDLIVTSSSGRVWTVNQTGVVTLIANVATHIEGPAVAPSSFGDYGGDLLVAAQPLGEVLAISPTGTVSTVAQWPTAESIAFPSDCRHCGFVDSKAVFFVANETAGTIEEFPASFFPTLKGVGVVDSESNGGIASFTAGGSMTSLASHTRHLEQIAFVSCFPHLDHGKGGWDR